MLLIDEAAFIDQIGEIWASAQQTLATGGGAIVLSTPYGTGNWFHKTWVSAENNQNDFLEHVDKPGPWSEEDDKIHTIGGLTMPKENTNKLNK